MEYKVCQEVECKVCQGVCQVECNVWQGLSVSPARDGV